MSQIHPNLALQPLDPQRLYDPLEKEVIWNRDRGLCQNPQCQRPDKKVPFREVTVHHVVEHTVGGRTVIQNGVLICPECHTDRAGLQRLAPTFQEYLRRIYSPRQQEPLSAIFAEPANDNDQDGGRAGAARLRIAIDWGALDVDRETQILSGGAASDLIAKLLVELIRTFGKPMEQQLTEVPVIRYPLSRDPASAFVNPATGVPFSSIHLPGTDLHFCAISSTREKQRRLTQLLSLLTLPDGRSFPEGSIECTVESEPF